MQPFAKRLRLGLNDLDFDDPEAGPRVHKAKWAMKAVLERKRIPQGAAELTIRRAFDAAADYQIQRARAEQADRGRADARENLQALLGHVRRLSRAVAELSPTSKGELSRLIVAKDWTEFDAEMFVELFDEMLDALRQLSPERHANDARVAIRESLARNGGAPTPEDRWGPPALIQLWECIPDATRLKVEADLRKSKPPAKGQVTWFLDRLRSLLERHSKRDAGRRNALVGVYLASIRAIWQRLGLKVAEARGGSRDATAESSIQQFANLALRGVGDDTVITIRQIRKLKGGKTKRSCK